MSSSLMAYETRQIPDKVATQLTSNGAVLKQISESIKAYQPLSVMMIGRGSSDHAGVYAKYLIETELGLPVSAAAPSVSTLFGKTLKLERTLVLCISQSGQSPDILSQVQKAKQSGALTIAIVNDESSPLAISADHVLPLHADKERAVAATKSFVCTLTAIASLVSVWANVSGLQEGLRRLPLHLATVAKQAPQLQYNHLKDKKHCIVLGRGFGYAVSREIALKLKEVCSIHAEAFSSAEFLHGPITLVGKQLRLIDVCIEDETFAQHSMQIKEVKKRGGGVITLSNINSVIHPRLAVCAIMLRFYLDIEQIAQQMELNPDAPIGLKKVTQTL